MGKWNDFIRRLHKILERNTLLSQGTCTLQVKELNLAQAAKTEPQQTLKAPLERISFKFGVFLEMLTEFARALPNETIIWLSGVVEEGVGIVEKSWECELESSSPFGAKVKPEWLVEFAEKLRNFYPEHNLIIEAHNHPIGPSLSSIDKDGLFAISDWKKDSYWMMVACDFRLGCYVVERNDLKRIPWRIEDGKKTGR